MYLSTKQSGFSLLEALISIVIISIGLLGIASLQLNAVSYTNDSYLRTQAMLLVDEMADRMRANYPETQATGANPSGYDYYNANHATPKTDLPTLADYPAGCNSDDDVCASTTDRAMYEYIFWTVNRVGALLPDGTAVLCRDSDPTNDDDNGDPCDPTDANVCNANNGSPYVIRVCWSETGRDVNRDGVIDANDNFGVNVVNNRFLKQYYLTF